MGYAAYLSDSSEMEDNEINIKQGRRRAAIERYEKKMKERGWLSTREVSELMDIAYTSAHKTLTQTLCPLYLVDYKKEDGVNYWRWK